MSEVPEVPELPRGVALAWGVAQQSNRGPKRELSIEAIVGAAIELADREGLDAVSMGKVATALGFTTMSLYRYVSAKDDLLLLMRESALGPAPAVAAREKGWRPGLNAWMDALIARYAGHRWLLQVAGAKPPMTPNSLSWLDRGLQLLADSPLTFDEQLAVVLLLDGHARWEVALGTAAESDADVERYVQGLRQLVGHADLPALWAALDGGLLAGQGPDPMAAGRNWVLDGIEQHLHGRAAGPASAADRPPRTPPATSTARDPFTMPEPPEELGDEATEQQRWHDAESVVAAVKDYTKEQVSRAQQNVQELRRQVKVAERFVEEQRRLGESRIAVAKQQSAQAKARMKAAIKKNASQ